MFPKKKNYTHKNRPVLGLKHREDDDASVTTKHCGVDVGSVYRNNTRSDPINYYLLIIRSPI